MQKDLYIKQLEEDNESLIKKNEELMKLIEDITSNKAIQQNEIDSLDVTFCGWIVPRLKMLLNKESKVNKIQKDFMLMIDGFSIPITSEKYPVISQEEALKLNKALKLFQKRFGNLWY